jgi:hypothetical protein
MAQIPFSLWFKKSSRPKCAVTLEDINNKLDIIMITLDDILNATTEQSGVDDSIITLLTGIHKQLVDVLAGGFTEQQQAKVEAIFAAVKANKDKVAAAVVANPTPTTT